MSKRKCLMTFYPTECKENCFNCKCGGAAKVRSKTFEGIAQAMAQQWGEYIIQECEQP